MYYSLFEMVRHKKNWDTEDGEASEQLHQKRNSFYLKITLEVSFFFSLEKKRISQSFNGWFQILCLFICKNHFLTNDKEHRGKGVVSKQKILFLDQKLHEARAASFSTEVVKDHLLLNPYRNI